MWSSRCCPPRLLSRLPHPTTLRPHPPRCPPLPKLQRLISPSPLRVQPLLPWLSGCTAHGLGLRSSLLTTDPRGRSQHITWPFLLLSPPLTLSLKTENAQVILDEPLAPTQPITSSASAETPEGFRSSSSLHFSPYHNSRGTCHSHTSTGWPASKIPYRSSDFCAKGNG